MIMKLSLFFLLSGLFLFNVSRVISQEAAPVAQSNPSPAALTNSPPLSAEANMFHDALAPYGSWIWLDPYGWIWSPSGMDVTWRPYTYGSWVYADCGWTWASDFEWGWAPFHYGRWCWHTRHGWCWVPGSVWAPAWVAWNFGDAWCGWAPLPPLVAWETFPNWDVLIPAHGWCFVANRDFCRRHVHDHIVVAARNVTLLRETKNVTRFEIKDRRVVNVSLSTEQIERVTGRRVARYKVVDVASDGAPRAARMTKGEIRFFRPELKQPALASTSRMFAPPQPRSVPSAAVSIPHAPPPATFDQLRQNELERRRIEASQAQQRSTLERWHQRELEQPPRGLSPPELQQRHQAEHRAFLDQLHREDELFESRAQEQYNRIPSEVQRAVPSHSQSRGARSSRAYR